MMYPARRLFHVKIWLTEVSSDDDDDEERIVVCKTPPSRVTTTHLLRPTAHTHHLLYQNNHRRKKGKSPLGFGKKNSAMSSDCDSSEGYETFDELSYLGYVSCPCVSPPFSYPFPLFSMIDFLFGVKFSF